ncbi:MAG: hypothetical protein ACOYJD_04850 [Christensenellales bacterium]
MARFLAKAKEKIVKNIYIYIFILFFFAAGFSASVFTFKSFPVERVAGISDYLHAFLEAARGGVPFFSVLWQALATNIPALLIIILSGNWMAASPVALIVVSVKGFYVGMTLMALSSALPFFNWLALFVCCVLAPCMLVVPCYFNACRLSLLHAYAKMRLKHIPPPDKAEYIKLQTQTLIAMALGLAAQSAIQSLIFGALG